MVRLRINPPLKPSYLALFCRDLEKRGLISLSHPPLNLESNIISTLPNVLYAGFDPTADSFHIGNLLVITNLLRSCIFGCKPIALIGGGTAHIGDPSGRNSERKQLPIDIIHENSKSLLKQLVEILENAKALYGTNLSLSIVNNLEWYAKMSVLDFMRVTKSFRVAEILKIGPIRSRMTPHQGISFTEFAYPIFQSYDWYILAKNFDCYFQLGGSDQLGNIEAGYDYIQKQLKSHTFGVCFPLLTDSNGQKLGKSTIQNGLESDNVWLNESKTSPFALYQYFRQMPDELIMRLLLYLSLKSTGELETIISEHKRNPGLWLAQTTLADEMVELIHGKTGLEMSKSCSKIVFSGSLEEFNNINDNMICSLFGSASTFNLSRYSIKTFGELANQTRKDPRKSGTHAMKEGAFYINGQKFKNPDEAFSINNFLIRNRFSLISWGKRKHFLVDWR